MHDSTNNQLQFLPSVQTIIEALQDQPVKPAILTEIIRREMSRLRHEIFYKKQVVRSKSQARCLLEERVSDRIRSLLETPLKRVVNATGIVLHTGLGRAPLGEHVLQYLLNMTSGYLNLEFNLDNGKRGERLDLTEDYLTLLTGAESSAVVNNNAAAVLLMLNSLASRKEVIISRGELIEIGGSFRLPDVMKKSGVKMVEIGTTNRTHFRDYEEAISNRTGAILIAHTSNYRVEGFTKKPAEADIISLAHRHEIPVILDLGSGALLSTDDLGLPYETPVADAVSKGFDLVSFSGDKLLGAGQAGLIVGRQSFVRKIRKNPLMRVLRCDKITLGILVFALSRYISDREIPDLTTYDFLTARADQLQSKARTIINSLKRGTRQVLKIDICKTVTEAGSGSMPTETLPSIALSVTAPGASEEQLAGWFRQQDPPVIGYLKDRRFYLDLKAVSPKELPFISNALDRIAQHLKNLQE